MRVMTDAADIVSRIGTDVRNRLATIDPAPFTPSAFRLLQDSIDEFIVDLLDESFRIAKRHKSEVVSANYVEAAGTYLVASRARRVFRHMGTVGGILLGGSLSNILAMAQTGSAFPVVGTLVSVGVGLLGSFLVAVHIAKD